MKIVCCCFSGTGNTEHACEELLKNLEKNGHITSLFSIRKDAERPSLEDCDCLILGYPVHGFNAPAPVLKYLKSLEKTKKQTPCYLLRTSGEPLKLNNASGISPKRILKKKGYVVLGEFHYVLPYNIIFRHSDGMAARMKRGVELRLPADAEKIGNAETFRTKVGPFSRLVSFACRIEHTAMPLIGRHFKATEKCIGCGKCELVCPQGNICMEGGRPRFGKSCVGCMGCVFSCTEDAIHPSIFNGWKVNGPYAFDASPATDDEVCRYCHKAYLRYFHEGESIPPRRSKA